MSRYIRAVCLVVIGCAAQTITHTHSQPYTDALKQLDMAIPVRLLLHERSSLSQTHKDTIREMIR